MISTSNRYLPHDLIKGPICEHVRYRVSTWVSEVRIAPSPEMTEPADEHGRIRHWDQAYNEARAVVAARGREDAGLMDVTSIPFALSRRHRSSLLFVGIWLDWMARHPTNAPFDMNRRVLYWWLKLLLENGGRRAQQK